MANIKIPSTQGQLTSQPTATIQRPSDFTREQEAVQSLLDKSAQVSEIFRRAIVTDQVATETIAFNQELNTLELAAKSSPNLNETSADLFQGEAVKALQQHLDKIGDPQVTREFEVQNRSVILGKTNGVRAAGRRAQMDRFVVQSGEIRDQQLNNIYGSNNPVIQKVYRQRYIDQLNRGVDSLYISREEREKQVLAFDESARLGKPQKDLEIATAAGEDRTTEDRINGAKEIKISAQTGAYGLNPQELTKFIGQIDGFIKVMEEKNVGEISLRQSTKWKEILPAVKTGEITEAQLRILGLPTGPEKDDGLISNEMTNEGIALLNSFRSGTATDNRVYQRIKNMIAANERKDDGSIFSTDEIDLDIARNGQFLDEEDFQELINANNSNKKTTDDRTISAAVNGLKGRIRNTVLRSTKIQAALPSALLGEGVASVATAMADEFTATFHRTVLEEKASGDRITEIANEVYDQFLKANGLFVGKGSTANFSVPIEGEIKRHFSGQSSAKPDFKLVPIGQGKEESKEVE